MDRPASAVCSCNTSYYNKACDANVANADADADADASIEQRHADLIRIADALINVGHAVKGVVLKQTAKEVLGKVCVPINAETVLEIDDALLDDRREQVGTQVGHAEEGKEGDVPREHRLIHGSNRVG